MDNKVCIVTLMDNTQYCFPLSTYKRLPHVMGARTIYQRIKHHTRHPDEIHIDLFGIIKCYYDDYDLDDPMVRSDEQIKAFFNGDEWVYFGVAHEP